MPTDSNAGPESIRVRIEADAASGGAHDVLIGAGLIRQAAGLITAASPAHRYAIITDSIVEPLHARHVADSLAGAGAFANTLTFPAGESSKTRESWSALTDEMLRLELGRDTCVVVVGGGVAGDLAGFVAATFMRGIPWVNLPTTLLAMLDSAVGGKTGVDTPAGKNLVGVFHQPALVVIDPEVLATLPDRAYRASLAEAVKHGAIADEEYFEWIDSHADSILARDAGVLTELVLRSIEIKAAIVNEDTFEAGRRAILNFGHTIAHALERATNYDMAHGEAVAIGMVLEARIGELAGITEPATSARIGRALTRFGLPIDESNLGSGVETILRSTRSDKKARGSVVRYSLLSRVGTPHGTDSGEWTQEVSEELIRTAAGADG